MTAAVAEREEPPSRLALAVVIAAFLALAGWAMLQAFVPPASRTCRALYAAARTAADSARIDTTVPARDGGRYPDAHSCHFIRTTARW